jgi:hypothetical protein
MATDINYYYRNNNPGNIKVSKGWTGDFYLGTQYYKDINKPVFMGKEPLPRNKYKKFDTKAEGLAAIIDTMKNYMTSDIDTIMSNYAASDVSGTVINDYAEQLKKHYNVVQNIDFDDDEQLINIMKGVTDLENPDTASQYYKQKDYEDAVNLYRESKLFTGLGTVEEQIKDTEMQGLNLNG